MDATDNLDQAHGLADLISVEEVDDFDTYAAIRERIAIGHPFGDRFRLQDASGQRLEYVNFTVSNFARPIGQDGQPFLIWACYVHEAGWRFIVNQELPMPNVARGSYYVWISDYQYTADGAQLLLTQSDYSGGFNTVQQFVHGPRMFPVVSPGKGPISLRLLEAVEDDRPLLSRQLVGEERHKAHSLIQAILTST